MRVLELHAQMNISQRSKGHCAVAKAAYISGSKFYDQRTGQWKDYAHKAGVEYSALLLPDNAPDWVHDPQALFNAAEAKENRKNSQVARELIYGLPHEFTAEQRREADFRISQALVERYGVGVFFAQHAPDRQGDRRNYHTHAVFTVRAFDAEQADGWAKNKTRELSDFSKAKGAEHSRAVLELMWIRETVASVQNEIAAAHGHDVYVEHLSFEQRGLDRDAMQHMGPSASDMERRGHETEIGEKNRAIRAENEARERREAEQKIIDLAAERERRREAKEALDAARESEIKATAMQRREALYQQAQLERAAMLDAQRARFEEREAALASELAALHRSAARNGLFGFVRFWHHVSGGYAADREKITAMQAEYDRMQAEKRREAQAFEQRRIARLEALKRHEQEQESARAQVIEINARRREQRQQDEQQAQAIEPRKRDAYNARVRASTEQRELAEKRLAARKLQQQEQGQVSERERAKAQHAQRALDRLAEIERQKAHGAQQKDRLPDHFNERAEAQARHARKAQERLADMARKREAERGEQKAQGPQPEFNRERDAQRQKPAREQDNRQDRGRDLDDDYGMER